MVKLSKFRLSERSIIGNAPSVWAIGPPPGKTSPPAGSLPFVSSSFLTELLVEALDEAGFLVSGVGGFATWVVARDGELSVTQGNLATPEETSFSCQI